ncbi:MAG: glycerol-3-phosphate 1-O-acyltransferase PlsY [Rickettsiales bacterium]|jgi:glycerol-3-phosphate acyltransferase PlsY|nr:glycerol-3-phosphate 1-O-acyltransferase PlsY [Rickettsiales bacterium]
MDHEIPNIIIPIIIGIVFLLGYFIGSIPFGLIFTRLAGTEDIRKIGSGNIGATNVLRTGKKWVALLVLIFDMLKGCVAYMAVGSIGGFAAVIGHNFPIWLKFKGGKGMATTMGFLLGCNPLLFVICAVVWLSSVFITKISSLSALLALLVAPIAAVLIGVDLSDVIFIVMLSVLGFYRHRENIKRLIAGTESKVKLNAK